MEPQKLRSQNVPAYYIIYCKPLIHISMKLSPLPVRYSAPQKFSAMQYYCCYGSDSVIGTCKLPLSGSTKDSASAVQHTLETPSTLKGK